MSRAEAGMRKKGQRNNTSRQGITGHIFLKNQRLRIATSTGIRNSNYCTILGVLPTKVVGAGAFAIDTFFIFFPTMLLN